MFKRIYIVTTRSFNDDTLFNKKNCTQFEYDKDGNWYKIAFPQYFTDIIQFADIREVGKIIFDKAQIIVKGICRERIDELIKKYSEKFIDETLGEIEKQKEKTEDIVQTIEKEGNGDPIKIEWLKKKIANFESKSIKLHEFKSVNSDLFHSIIKQAIVDVNIEESEEGGEIIDKIESVACVLLVQVWNSILANEVTDLEDIASNVVHLNRSNTKNKNIQEFKQTVNLVITNLLIHIITESIPSWWPKMLYFKHRCLYWSSKEANECYNYLKTTGIFKEAEEKHSKELKNQFSIESPIYKYNSGSEFMEWYIVQCFDMRTDPDFGLKYMLSLVHEIEKQYPDKSCVYRFHLLIHDYDIGRKLNRSSVLLSHEKKYDIVLDKIKKTLAEKELENIWKHRENLRPYIALKDDFFKKYQFVQPKIDIESLKSKDFQVYADTITDLDNSDLKRVFSLIDDIIVFKHNKGKIAGILKSGKVDMLANMFYYMQNIIELRINLIIDLDAYLYGRIRTVQLNNRIKTIFNIIKKTLNSCNNKSNDSCVEDLNFLIDFRDALETFILEERISNENKVHACIELLIKLNSL